MPNLILTQSVYDGLVQHATAGMPLEICGYCAEKGGIVERQYPLTNIDQSGEHFTMDPAEQFAAVRQMRADGYRATVVYHSHPHTPARPSAEDIRLAFDPTVHYVIISMASVPPVIKSFHIANGEVTPEEIEIATVSVSGKGEDYNGA